MKYHIYRSYNADVFVFESSVDFANVFLIKYYSYKSCYMTSKKSYNKKF